MPGTNCSIVGCGSCRRIKGIGIFKVPAEKVDKTWRDNWLGEIKKTRVVDEHFKMLIKNDSVYTCEYHFSPEDIEIRKFILINSTFLTNLLFSFLSLLSLFLIHARPTKKKSRFPSLYSLIRCHQIKILLQITLL